MMLMKLRWCLNRTQDKNKKSSTVDHFPKAIENVTEEYLWQALQEDEKNGYRIQLIQNNLKETALI